MHEEDRKAGAYTITQSFRFGEIEFVLGENPDDTNGHKYVLGFYESNGLYEKYTFTHGSDFYSDVAEEFGRSIQNEAVRFRSELEGINVPEKDMFPVGKDKYCAITSKDDLTNQVLVLRPEILRPEYRSAIYQIVLCVGSFGAQPNSRGSACYCVNLINKENMRYARSQVVGILKPESIPEWAKKAIQQMQEDRKKENRMEGR